MKITSIRVFMALVGLFLLLSMTNVQAQQGNPLITSTLRWQIAEELCPDEGNCYQIRRVSADGNRLYFFTGSDSQLHIVDANNQISHYDLSTQPGITMLMFDFVPYRTDSIIFLDNGFGRLFVYNLNTQTAAELDVGRRFTSCSVGASDFHRSFSWAIPNELLAVCARGSATTDTAFSLLLVDPNVPSVQEIAPLIGARTGLFRGWEQVVGGWDHAVYIQSQSPENLFFRRYDLQSANWQTIEIPWQTFDEHGIAWGTIFSVDAQSNIYFVGHFMDESTRRFIKQYTEISLDGEIIWDITDHDLGIQPALIDGASEGGLIIVDRPSFDSTIGYAILEAVVNLP